MFTGFKKFRLETAENIFISGRSYTGQGPTLLLLHGYPQNHRIWRRIASELTREYSIVVLDLRGYGQSSKPAGDATHSMYSKSNMAKDCMSVMEQLGYKQFFICAHDRGARVAHKLCVDFPSAVWKVILLDICPTKAMYQATDYAFAKAYYHWFFLIQDAPFPENMILSNPQAFMEKALGVTGLEKFDAECLQSYFAMMRDPDTIHATCEDYRASASIDIEEATGDQENGRKIECPLMILWGKKGVIEVCFDPLLEWRQVTNAHVIGQAIDCGHYIPEEAPEALLGHIRSFLVQSET